MDGIPKLLRNLKKAVQITLLGNSINNLWNYLFPASQWGVFLPGQAQQAIEVSSVVSLDVVSNARASDYPIQTGSFLSYNKVRLPDVFRVQITIDGNEQTRSAFLSWLETNMTATSLFDVVCPEKRWTNSTLVDYRIARSLSSGAAMLVVECVFQQIRELPATFKRLNITNPENQPSTPTARVSANTQVPNSSGGVVLWR